MIAEGDGEPDAGEPEPAGDAEGEAAAVVAALDPGESSSDETEPSA